MADVHTTAARDASDARRVLPADLDLVLVHDYLTQPGGAERVVATLSREWPEAEVHTLLYEPATTFPEFRERRVVTSPLQPFAGHVSHRALHYLQPPSRISESVLTGECSQRCVGGRPVLDLWSRRDVVAGQELEQGRGRLSEA